MADEDWASSLHWCLVSEGGNDDDPHDPGGRTSRGIIQREYNAYREHLHLPMRDVWAASDDEVSNIYRASYWMPYCPGLPPGVDYLFFDESVNAGLHASVLVLQRALGVLDDGHIGLITSGAMVKAYAADPAALLKNISAQRVRYYRALHGFARYGRGWLSRVAFAEKNAGTLLHR